MPEPEKGGSHPDNIAIHRDLAYIGGVGRRRKQFCIDYITGKQQFMAGMVATLRERASAEGGAISCSAGCSACCYLYVIANLQECEAIVYYLYQHEEKLRHFVDSFSAWREKVDSVWDTFLDISRLQQKRMSGEATAADDQTFDTALVTYRALDTPCPFLADGVCSIYEVRPYVCAALVTTTPAEWCGSRHPERARARHLKASTRLEGEICPILPDLRSNRPCPACRR
jgi:Fe-S-cluster containining protein